MIECYPVFFIYVSGIWGAPTQRETDHGEKDHWYEVVLVESGIAWTAASNAAEADGGYLASITSAGENNFLFGYQ